MKTKQGKTKKKSARGLGYYLKQHKGGVTGYVVALTLSQALNVAAVFLAAFFLAELVEGSFDTAIVYLLAGAVCLVANKLVYFVYGAIYYKLFAQISFKIKTDLSSRAFEISSRAFSGTASGIFINRINYDPESALSAVDDVLEHVMAILSVVVTLGYIIFNNWVIGLIFVGALVFLFFFENIKNKVFARNEKIHKKAAERATSLTAEIVRSERDIKSLNLEGKLKVLASEKYGDQTRKARKTKMTNYTFWSARNVIVQTVLAAALLVGIFLVRDYRMTMAAFLFVYTNRASFEGFAWNYGRVREQITVVKVSSGRMFEIFDEEKFPIEKFGDADIELKGEVEFRNVDFCYIDDVIREDDGEVISSPAKNPRRPEEENKTYKKVFDKLSFKIPANKTVAFCGKSGSGKTTILSLINKLFDVDGGEVLLDGVDIKTLSKATLRDGISLVNQFPYIFNTTIKENLLMANKAATDAEIHEAAKQASLHDFILSLRKGYDTKVGEGGIKLSGGQKQRLAIARALLRKSKIILFDESTSSLDNTTQNEIKEAIGKLSGGHTVVIVAHRLSTIKNADIIFYLEDGKVVAQGPFKTLVKTSAGFKEFFEAELAE